MKAKEYGRAIGLIILGVATALGVYQFVAGDYRGAVQYWRTQWAVFPIVLLLATADVALEAVGWMWVYERFRIRTRDSGGVLAYLSGRAGLLLPAQLGRLIRPDALARLGRASMRDCLKAEAVAFVLDTASVTALMAGLVAYHYHPLAALGAVPGVIVVSLFFGNRFAGMLSKTGLALPNGFWWRWQTVAIILIEMAGWLAHGLAFFVIVRGLPGSPGWWEPVFLAPASAVLGVGSGLPGGIGATEGLLGISLSIMVIPAHHFALAVGGFRLLTFWIWLPVGWAALAMIRSRASLMSWKIGAEDAGEQERGIVTGTG